MTSSGRRVVQTVAGLLFALLGAPGSPQADHGLDYDLILRGGTLYRGGFEMAGPGDVAILGDRIAAVGEVHGKALREIDVSGLVVAPGFIDLHTHTDEIYRVAGRLPLPGAIRANRNYLTQGVTTIVTGNCGSGFATPEAIEGWLERVDRMPFGSNVIHLIPHGQLRLEAMGGAQGNRTDPHPSPDEMALMKEWVDRGMQAGAWGMATGLEYDPGARSGTLELVELNRVVAEHGGVYASHTRHEGPEPASTIASYAEAITIGEQTGTPVHISHIKLAGRAVHGMTAQVIALVEAARARGVAVTADQYPYPAGSTTLAMSAPVAMRDGSSVLDEYCEGEGRQALHEGVARFLRDETPAEGLLVSVYPWRWWWQGKTVAQLAEERGEDPVDVAVGLACGRAGAGIYFSQNEDDVRAFMRREWVATASDGVAIVDFIGRWAHPRLYGTFPRKLRRYVFDEGWIELAFALRSMTELPAQAFGIPDRGRLEPGAFADVVAFDPDRIRDVATFEHSGRHSQGVEYLVVNGVLSLYEGRVTDHRGGRALRHATPGEGSPGSPEQSATPHRSESPSHAEPNHH